MNNQIYFFSNWICGKWKHSITKYFKKSFFNSNTSLNFRNSLCGFLYFANILLHLFCFHPKVCFLKLFYQLGIALRILNGCTGLFCKCTDFEKWGCTPFLQTAPLLVVFLLHLFHIFTNTNIVLDPQLKQHCQFSWFCVYKFPGKMRVL